MKSTQTSLAANFRSLHESGCFVLPNPWDIGTAIYLEQLGFKAPLSPVSFSVRSFGPRKIAEKGTLDLAGDAVPFGEINGAFSVRQWRVLAKKLRSQQSRAMMQPLH